MKIKIIALILASLTFANAAEEKAPNGGRIIEAVTPHAEFLVTKDKKVEIRFLEAGKVIAPADQVVTVTTGDRTNPTKLAFTKDGDKLVSDKAVPEGENLPVVLQIRAKEGEKALNAKFTLNLATCPECKLAEYACSCEHGGGEGHEGHVH
ncbi:MAG: hypothetical protein ABIS50_06720 [Luteolibacter sp.]|uniref:hypothetical protein n=1 Tax=Luteolibacter sp. TaxID=1962973 RepID=UPI003264FE41